MKKATLVIAFATVFLLSAQAFLAFALPYAHRGESFCRVQPRLKEKSIHREQYVRSLHEIRLIGNFLDIDIGFIIEALGKNGNKMQGFPFRQIFFGYSDGRDLYGWSFARFSYYRLPERNQSDGKDSAISECARILNKL